ncbi:procyclic form-specific polypeptide B-alpha [Drosophila santomea]|uniref:procyclic form-specific polypeptide B-alpha n=1 Tax=Drosophila santomea TaxID=129105 RepID=UPI001CCECFA9|nr:procyclic form-specific polypeptide B-alpha [Drosophila santomea]
MKFLTVFAFACVATFVVLHGAYGSPLPEPVPVPEPSPVAEPKPNGDPAANPGTAANPSGGPAEKPKPKADEIPNAVPPASLRTSAIDDNLVVPLLEAAPQKQDEVQAEPQQA